MENTTPLAALSTGSPVHAQQQQQQQQQQQEQQQKLKVKVRSNTRPHRGGHAVPSPLGIRGQPSPRSSASPRPIPSPSPRPPPVPSPQHGTPHRSGGRQRNTPSSTGRSSPQYQQPPPPPQLPPQQPQPQPQPPHRPCTAEVRKAPGTPSEQRVSGSASASDVSASSSPRKTLQYSRSSSSSSVPSQSLSLGQQLSALPSMMMMPVPHRSNLNPMGWMRHPYESTSDDDDDDDDEEDEPEEDSTLDEDCTRGRGTEIGTGTSVSPGSVSMLSTGLTPCSSVVSSELSRPSSPFMELIYSASASTTETPDAWRKMEEEKEETPVIRNTAAAAAAAASNDHNHKAATNSVGLVSPNTLQSMTPRNLQDSQWWVPSRRIQTDSRSTSRLSSTRGGSASASASGGCSSPALSLPSMLGGLSTDVSELESPHLYDSFQPHTEESDIQSLSQSQATDIHSLQSTTIVATPTNATIPTKVVPSSEQSSQSAISQVHSQAASRTASHHADDQEDDDDDDSEMSMPTPTRSYLSPTLRDIASGSGFWVSEEAVQAAADAQSEATSDTTSVCSRQSSFLLDPPGHTLPLQQYSASRQSRSSTYYEDDSTAGGCLILQQPPSAQARGSYLTGNAASRLFFRSSIPTPSPKFHRSRTNMPSLLPPSAQHQSPQNAAEEEMMDSEAVEVSELSSQVESSRGGEFLEETTSNLEDLSAILKQSPISTPHHAAENDQSPTDSNNNNSISGRKCIGFGCGRSKWALLLRLAILLFLALAVVIPLVVVLIYTRNNTNNGSGSGEAVVGPAEEQNGMPTMTPTIRTTTTLAPTQSPTMAPTNNNVVVLPPAANSIELEYTILWNEETWTDATFRLGPIWPFSNENGDDDERLSLTIWDDTLRSDDNNNDIGNATNSVRQVLAATVQEWQQAPSVDLTLRQATTFSSRSERDCAPLPGQVRVCRGSYGESTSKVQSQLYLQGRDIVAATIQVNDDVDVVDSGQQQPPPLQEQLQYELCHHFGHVLGLFHSETGCLVETFIDDASKSHLHPDSSTFYELDRLYATRRRRRQLRQRR